jgi:hypothetical protein
VGPGGSAALERLVTGRERAFPGGAGPPPGALADRAYPRTVLRAGSERARAIADDTLAQGHALMHTVY